MRMVAKRYEAYEIQGEPFREDGKWYVNVKIKKEIKKVRWYSDAEYARMYPESTKDIMDFDAHYAFGFRNENYITIFKGDESVIKAWAQVQYPPRAWYNLTFHYYTPGFMPVTELPQGITPIKLTWDEVKVNDTKMKPHDEVNKYVMGLIGMDSVTSRFQGEKNEWLTKKVTVRENTKREDKFGEKHTHYLVDTEGNTYVWETGTKNYPIDTSISLKMKVKEHKKIKNEDCTIVWYCKEV